LIPSVVGHTPQRNGEVLDLGCLKCVSVKSMHKRARPLESERSSYEIATNKGWSDFCRWVGSLPGKRFPLLTKLAKDGTCTDPYALYDEIHAAAKISKPDASVKAVANGLLKFLPDSGEVSVGQEPDDSELDEE
jgi:hypothetical protein